MDLQIDSISKRMGEIDRIRKDNSGRRTIEDSLSKENSLLAEIKVQYENMEEKFHSKKMKIEQSEASLYGGSIKNPKELQDLQSEIKSLKSNLSSLEDEQLQLMIDQETIEKEILEIQQTLQILDSQLEVQFSSLYSEEQEKKIALDKINQERKAVLEQVNSENLTIYQTLRKSKNGIALSTIEEGCCLVCGSTLTPADCQTAKSPLRMAYCSSCGRILYAG